MSMAENGVATAKLWKKQGKTFEESMAYLANTKKSILELKKDLDVKLEYLAHVRLELEHMEWEK